MSRKPWAPPEWWPSALAELLDGATYVEAGRVVERTPSIIQRVDARLGFPGRQATTEPERDIACLCCGCAAQPPQLVTGAPKAKTVALWRERPLCGECRPLGKAAWLLRGQGMAWHEVAAKLQAYPHDGRNIAAAKVNYKARRWAKERGYTPKPIAKRDEV